MRRFFIPCMIVLFMAGACTVQESEKLCQSENHQELVFTAESGEEQTKTAFQADETSIWWSPRDQICIFYGDSEGSQFTATNDTETAKAVFTGTLNAFTGEAEVGVAHSFWAIYPYSSAISCDGSSIVASLSNHQVAKAGSFAPNTNISIAKSSGMNLSFFNACSWFRFSVQQEGITSVTFRGNNGEIVAGEFSVSMGEDGRPTVPSIVEGKGKTEIVLSAPIGKTLEVGKYYYITLFPQIFEKGFTVTFETNSLIGSRSVERSATYLRSKYNTGTTFDKTINYTAKSNIASQYQIGDIVDEDGVGIVVSVGTEAVLLMSVEESDNLCWEDAKEWCEAYGSLWRMPSIDELSVISSNYETINTILSNRGLTSLSWYKNYWSSSQRLNPYSANYYEWIMALGGDGGSIHSQGRARAVKIVATDPNNPPDPIESLSFVSTEISIHAGESLLLSVAAFPKSADYSTIVFSSSDGNTASVNQNGLVTGINYGKVEIVAFHGNKRVSCIINVDCNYTADPVDMGLSVYWSSQNLGAGTPYVNGAFFAWNEISPKYTYSDETYSGFTNNVDRFVTHDAAQTLLPEGWRIPTRQEWEELLTQCVWEDFNNYVVITSRINENSIILPKGGFKSGDRIGYAGYFIQYWTSDTFQIDDIYRACYFKSPDGQFEYGSETIGRSIRPVWDDTRISLSSSHLEVGVGDNAALTATILPESSASKNVEWFSSDSDVVQVDDTGIITALNPGSATITARVGGALANCIITTYNKTYIQFADELVESICISNWDSDNDGSISLTEAASISTLNDVFKNTEIVEFDELQYFSGLNSVEGFDGCTKLKSIIIPSNLSSIGDYAFRNCESLSSISIPQNITTIGVGAFYGCTSLSAITLPKSITRIESNVFSGCVSLTSLYLPESITSLGTGVFKGCSNLVYIKLPEGITQIEDYTFNNCTSLKSIYIPGSVTFVGNYAFDGCSVLPSVLLPDNLVTLGKGAFSNCKALTSIIIPTGVNHIESASFSGCSSLSTVILPDSLEVIGNSAFDGCSLLPSIDLPDNLVTLGVRAFYRCKALTSIIIPTGVKCIEYDAFSGCSHLSTVILPDSLETIGAYAFNECGALSEINFPNSLNSIGIYAFQSCTKLKEAVIPSVSQLGKFAFYKCSKLSTVVLSESLTAIEESVFDSCSDLSSVIIPNSVLRINKRAFYDCSLQSIILPSNVKTIGVGAFGGKALSTIISLSISPPDGCSNMFGYMFGYTNGCVIYVPLESVDTYKAAPYWCEYADCIQGIINE